MARSRFTVAIGPQEFGPRGEAPPLRSQIRWNRVVKPVRIKSKRELRTELRRLSHAEYWEREENIVTVAPTVTRTIEETCSYGLSMEHIESLASSLSLGIPGLLTQVLRSVSESTQIHRIVTRTESIALRGSDDPGSVERRYALWHHVEHFMVDELQGLQLTWFNWNLEDLQPLANADAIWARIVETSSHIAPDSVELTYYPHFR
jgi:hypothetical protein